MVFFEGNKAIKYVEVVRIMRNWAIKDLVAKEMFDSTMAAMEMFIFDGKRYPYANFDFYAGQYPGMTL